MGLTQLVSQTASGGTWRDSQLVLTGVSPVTVVYSGGAHKASSLETAKLVDIWHDVFGATPVTAAVQLSGGADDQHTVLVHVSNPAYDPKRGALQFDADDTNVEATGGLASFASTTDPLPATFGAATYRDFVVAFTYGYWGGKFGDSTQGFWDVFKPPAAPKGGKPAFAAARPGVTRRTMLPYNIWSETMFRFSDNYNIPYGEDYGSGAAKRQSPLLDVPDGGTWRMTIGSDGNPGCLGKF